MMGEQANTRCATCGQLMETKRQSTQLSRREIEILEQVARGRTNQQIALSLGITLQTVKNHITAILHCLRVRDRTSAVVCAIRERWIMLPEED